MTDARSAKTAPRTVILLFGGSSDERLVSVASAQNLLRLREDARPWFMRPDGGIEECNPDEILTHARPFEVPFRVRAPRGLGSLEDAVGALERSLAPVFLLAVHGGAEEDGTLQARFERLGAAFTGSGSAASALCFDKERAKLAVHGRDVAIGAGAVLDDDEAKMSQLLSDWLQRFGPSIAKPVCGGSSLGLHHILTPEDIARAVPSIVESGRSYLVEQLIEGVELSIGVIDEGSAPRPLPATEIRKAPGERFDYQGKYLGTAGVREVTPAQVAPELMVAAQRVAVTAHQALGCSGYSRTDIIVRNDGVPVFLETNTLPGLTQSSLIPQQLAACNISLTTFLDTQLELAATRPRV